MLLNVLNLWTDIFHQLQKILYQYLASTPFSPFSLSFQQHFYQNIILYHMSEDLCSLYMFYYFFSFDNFYWLILSSLTLSSAVFNLLLSNWINCSFLILSISSKDVFSFHSFIPHIFTICHYLLRSVLFILRTFMPLDIQYCC